MNEGILSESEIKDIVKRLGVEITSYYKNIQEPLIFIGILKGSFIFLSDLVRNVNLPINIDFMMVSSYNGKNIQEKEIKVILDLNTPISNRDVILVEDIIDSGKSFNKILELLQSRNPKSLKTCVLLNKKEARVVDVTLDFCGIDIPNKFVCGYGLDDKQLSRNLPFVMIKD